ncbi:MAG: CapA family protein [Bacteroidota bacterium]
MSKRILGWSLFLCAAGVGSWLFLRAVSGPTPKKENTSLAKSGTPDNNPADSIITLVAVGDVMMGSNYPSESNCPPKNVKLLDPVADLLRNAELTFANLEGSVLNSGGERKQCSNPSVCYAFRQPEYFVDQMKEAGIDLFSVANNHLGDFGNTGRVNTCRVLGEKGFRFAGQEIHPWDTITVKGIRIGLTAFAPNRSCLQLNDYNLVKKTVTELKKKCDLVIVSFHGGAEGNSRTHVTRKSEQYVGENRGNVYEFARVAIDAGADVILGHGPHVPRAIDIYKGRFITYSMGNFCTYGQFGLSGATGIAPLFQLTIKGDGSFVEGKITSVKQLGEGGPVIDAEKSAQKLIESLTRSDIPEAPLKMDPDGKFRF